MPALAGAGIDDGFPDMALFAAPPDLPGAAGGDHIGPEGAVELIIPLGSQRRMKAGQVVEARQGLFPAAERTIAAAAAAAGHAGLPFMPLRTTPPDTAVAAGRYPGRCEGRIFLRVPLLRQLREKALEVVHAGQNGFTAAHRTVAPLSGPGGDGGLPLMSQLAAPPYFHTGTRSKIPGKACAVFLRVPLGRQKGMGGAQIVDILLHRAVAAHRAARAPAAAFQLGLPFMAFGAAPPDFLLAAATHVPGTKRSVLLRMPLSQKLFPPLPGTPLGQRFVHNPSFRASQADAKASTP